MNCPISHDQLVSYWARDLSEAESDAVDEHLFECSACFDAARGIAALASALRQALPPMASVRDLELARARGVHWVSNDFSPGKPKEAWFRRGVDVVVHRLCVTDPSRFEQVTVRFTTFDGTPLRTFADVPFDRASGAVLIACQRHFENLLPTPDINILVEGKDANGRQTVESFTVLHRYE